MAKEFYIFCDEMKKYNELIKGTSQADKLKKHRLEKLYESSITDAISFGKDEYIGYLIRMTLQSPNLLEIYGDKFLSLLVYITEYWGKEYIQILKRFCFNENFRLFLENNLPDQNILEKFKILMVFIASQYDVKDSDKNLTLLSAWIPSMRAKYPTVYLAVKTEIEKLSQELAGFGYVIKERELMNIYDIKYNIKL